MKQIFVVTVAISLTGLTTGTRADDSLWIYPYETCEQKLSNNTTLIDVCNFVREPEQHCITAFGEADCRGSNYAEYQPNLTKCTDSVTFCTTHSGFDSLHTVNYHTCTGCVPGYELQKKTASITDCYADIAETYGGSDIAWYYNDCVKNCKASNCAPDTTWIATGTDGYEKRTARSCSAYGTSGVCNATTEYRCAKNWYKTGTITASSGCTQCPEWDTAHGASNGDVYINPSRTNKMRGITGSAGATSVTSCFIYTGATYYDETGAFELTSNCGATN